MLFIARSLFWISNRISRRKMHKNPSYESAVFALNSLQSNASVIQMVKKKRQLCPENNILETMAYLEKIGIKTEQLDKLNIIHVSGTKGKGSTCAFTESILRKCGFRTGFYSSPHLVHVRERIRINGQPLMEREFARYFWEVYTNLEQITKVENWAMPTYFKFLTIMAFHVFLAEKIDVAIMEVGIGGAYDCTNVIRNPVVCGVTTLDYDHLSLLGNSLEEIAWQKAGIFKPNSVAVTIPQSQGCLAVLCQRAQELSCPLYLSPPFSSYQWSSSHVQIGIPGNHQYWNVTLALQITSLWMQRMSNSSQVLFDCDRSVQVCAKEDNIVYSLPVLPGFSMTKQQKAGLKTCHWPGRSQILRSENNITYFLDGAHTPKSVECCASWFTQEMDKIDNCSDAMKILLFSRTGDRQPEDLLPYLESCHFDRALFCTTLAHMIVDPSSDQARMTQSQVDDNELSKCEISRQYWTQLMAQRNVAQIGESSTTVDATVDCVDSVVLPCIDDALKWINKCAIDNQHVIVLVTGSLHLVGGVLGLLDPELKR